jgi:hypothetical protein
MLGVFAEFETDLHRERQVEGIARAKATGIHAGKGRPASIDAAPIRKIKAQGLGATAIAKALETAAVPIQNRRIEIGSEREPIFSSREFLADRRAGTSRSERRRSGQRWPAMPKQPKPNGTPGKKPPAPSAKIRLARTPLQQRIGSEPLARPAQRRSTARKEVDETAPRPAASRRGSKP